MLHLIKCSYISGKGVRPMVDPTNADADVALKGAGGRAFSRPTRFASWLLVAQAQRILRQDLRPKRPRRWMLSDSQVPFPTPLVPSSLICSDQEGQ